MPESSSQPSRDSDSDRLHQEAAELLGMVARGDRDAFEKIYDRFSGALLAFIKGYTQLEVAELLNEPLGTIRADQRRHALNARPTRPRDGFGRH